MSHIGGKIRKRKQKRRATDDGFKLPPHHPFAFHEVLKQPKAQPQLETKEGLTYEILHTGGFLRLYTMKGRVYWLIQNLRDHTTPDWKLHFSTHPDDLAKAWDILASLFMERQCVFGMKVVMRYPVNGIPPAPWPPEQWGRELTVYIFQWQDDYPSMMREVGLVEEQKDLWLTPQDEQTPAFWWSFIEEAERRLTRAQVRPSLIGCAQGDFPLTRFCSLRNEAYCIDPRTLPPAAGSSSSAFLSLFSSRSRAIQSSEHDQKQLPQQQQQQQQRRAREDPVYVYPPNACGWNAQKHKRLPLMLPLWRHYTTQLRTEWRRWRHEHEPDAPAAAGSAGGADGSRVLGRLSRLRVVMMITIVVTLAFVAAIGATSLSRG